MSIQPTHVENKPKPLTKGQQQEIDNQEDELFQRMEEDKMFRQRKEEADAESAAGWKILGVLIAFGLLIMYLYKNNL